MPGRAAAIVALSLAGVSCGCGLSAPARPLVAPVVLLVDASAPASVSGVYRTLGDALRAAPAGALVRVAPGEYRERLAISRPVLLLGSGQDKTRLVGPRGPGPVVAVRGTDGVELYNLSIEGGEGGEVGLHVEGGAGHALHGVALHGFRVAAIEARKADLRLSAGRIADVSGGVEGWGLDVQGGSVFVEGTVFRAAGRRALRVEGARAEVRGIDVEGSATAALQAIDGADVAVHAGTFVGGKGAVLYGGNARLSVDGAHIAGGEYGVVVARGAELELTRSRLERYTVSGVATVQADARIEHCRIEAGGSEAGIAVGGRGKRSVSILDVDLRSPGPMGIHATRGDLVVRGAVISGARLEGVDFGAGILLVDSQLVLEDAVLRGNAGAGVVSMQSVIDLHRNAFIENRGGGLRILLESTAAASRNSFVRNELASVEVADRSSVRLSHNRHGARAAGALDLRCTQSSVSQEGDVFVPPRDPGHCAN